MSQAQGQNLRTLIDELSDLARIKDRRFGLINLHIYAEHYVNELLIVKHAKVSQNTIRKRWKFYDKVSELKKDQTLNAEQAAVLNTLNDVRNLFVHNLNVSVEEATKKIKIDNLGFTYNWKVREASGRIAAMRYVDLKEEFEKIKLDRFSQLIAAASITIGTLHYAMATLKNHPIHEYMDVQFKKTARGSWEVSIQARENK